MYDAQLLQQIGGAIRAIADTIEHGTGKRIKVGITTLGSEHGVAEVVRGAELAAAANRAVEPVLIGPETGSRLPHHVAAEEKAAHHAMEELLKTGALDAAVTMHYNFPVGVATVGLITTPARGKQVFLATTTGTAALERVEAMVRNALYGIGVAKAMGLAEPTVGVLNLDGAQQVVRTLQGLAARGYPVKFAESLRADGGSILRGNDILAGSADVIVTDTLTGNLLVKIFSAFTTGGNYESVGAGYGPGVGEDFPYIINIISRASGAPVIAGAINYAAALAGGKVQEKVGAEIQAARIAGWGQVKPAAPAADSPAAVTPPPCKPVTAEIPGIDILEVERAEKLLWQHGIFARTGMGCTGPVVLVAPEDKEKAVQLLKEHQFLS